MFILDYKVIDNKVLIVDFHTIVGRVQVKTVVHDDDVFDLRKGLFIACAKCMYNGVLTPEGYEWKATEMSYTKSWIKIVDDAIKNHNKKLALMKAKLAEEEEEKKVVQRKIEKARAKRKKQEEKRANEFKSMISDAVCGALASISNKSEF